MQLTPRYGDTPVISIELEHVGEHPVLRQRRRLVETLRNLSADEWQHPSRCEGWTVQDVVSHLASTNGFWALSIGAGLAGEPTRFLTSFDPVATPASLVEQGRGASPADTLAELEVSGAALEAAVAGLDDAGWSTLAEAPPGHLPIRQVADHALWDCWVHERDILLPLGRTPVVDPEEVRCCLRYGAALGSAFEMTAGAPGRGPTVVEVTDPTERFVVDAAGDQVRVHAGPAPADAPVVRGDAVALVELLSTRDPGVPAPPGLQRLTAGLATVFDQPSVA